jgi:hypothetical protein
MGLCLTAIQQRPKAVPMTSFKTVLLHSSTWFMMVGFGKCFFSAERRVLKMNCGAFSLCKGDPA